MAQKDWGQACFLCLFWHGVGAEFSAWWMPQISRLCRVCPTVPWLYWQLSQSYPRVEATDKRVFPFINNVKCIWHQKYFLLIWKAFKIQRIAFFFSIHFNIEPHIVNTLFAFPIIGYAIYSLVSNTAFTLIYILPYFKENDNTFKFIRHVSTETSVIFS